VLRPPPGVGAAVDRAPRRRPRPRRPRPAPAPVRPLVQEAGRLLHRDQGQAGRRPGPGRARGGGPVTTGEPAAPAPRAPEALGGAGGELQAPPVNQFDPQTRTALSNLLLATADDEFVLGFWDSEWTGIAPILEEDVAFASLAQDEIGHAQALYQLLAELEGGDPDAIAFGRPPEGYR